MQAILDIFIFLVTVFSIIVCVNGQLTIIDLGICCYAIIRKMQQCYSSIVGEVAFLEVRETTQKMVCASLSTDCIFKWCIHRFARYKYSSKMFFFMILLFRRLPLSLLFIKKCKCFPNVCVTHLSSASPPWMSDRNWMR